MNGLLLNVCCAPCALPIIDHLLAVERLPIGSLALYFYGPNIFPEAEYLKRLEETRRIAVQYGLEFVEGGYDHNSWLTYLKERLDAPLESYGENSERCQLCFKFRLLTTAEYAAENNFQEFATTLSVSRFKDTTAINDFGEELARESKLKYRTFPLDADEAHKKGLELSRQYGVYRQKYCGCEFSLPPT
ncbi:hypothetical protein A3K48_07075 [candidate division WOR-1 bacterium RIFOXYA12_FULL_52_29]|uniref:Epoxyqueuosine reductase QueH n=1 Tax=candidate division WOR-1 bacterium RIFOXYC12_FULL_54_18 TaxID=1802584 RepID=A0A1F4T7K6_UNCSA|nr:MAG: hypothetical protein A3K44_07075 [candidate division WOR-1 bacterium RIFOXYA2_FULL_51_19]OGC18281.1 MAG: hypothetical protein A3K48_07075 [candidate division WOR-1 bacterium RIFOXYA12_FULL_52_29]OGC27136.1 MAG: hypothetical protein A3K32_07070 [candidate division WOR-1 bacterium RIFOXYB2_FULL_45_9]OGC28698.1 MAG: hypothetical protein A3K49_07075 [candidate division WOR-1 bacterium RIFOXYC12_FULL_54_18]OGC30847.1 MAG: hypothetical protein A2346_05545 [candidate division WOR-1 bacterium R